MIFGDLVSICRYVRVVETVRTDRGKRKHKVETLHMCVAAVREINARRTTQTVSSEAATKFIVTTTVYTDNARVIDKPQPYCTRVTSGERRNVL